jgi:hypothetical protein
MFLTLRDAKLLVRFFDSVDSIVTSRLIPDAKVDETHLTSTLRETLDERFTGFHALQYTLAQLKTDLATDDTSLKVSLSIEAKEYSRSVENRLNQADLGIIVRYDNFFRPDMSFSKAVLFQAKRLYRAYRDHSQTYSENDRFEGFDTKQLLRIIELTERHSSLLYYLFYCPRPEVYDDQSRRVLRYLTLPNSHWHSIHPFHWIEEYGFLPWWLHVQDYASDPNRHFPGLIASTTYWLREQYLERDQSQKDNSKWVVKAKQAAPSIRDVYNRMWNETQALSWFIVYRMLMGSEGASGDEAIGLAQGDGMSQELGVAPRFTLELRITLGGEGLG